MTSVQLTSNDVIELYKHMSAKYGSSIVDKESSTEMQLAGEFLDKMGILDKEAFLERYATTIGLQGVFYRVWIPFEPGDDTRSLLSQVRLITHEHQHVVQFDRDPFFGEAYVTDPSFRANAEGECYRCNMEVHYWATGAMLDPAKIAARLGAYALEEKHIDFAQQILEASAPTIARGGIHNQASKDVIRFLQSRGHEGAIRL